MGLFGRGKSGGTMNVIRCDEENYIVWKWRPEGQEVNSTSRENSIRWGSSLRVKDGEVAVMFIGPILAENLFEKLGTSEGVLQEMRQKTWRAKFDQVLMKGRSMRGDAEFQSQLDYYENLLNKN